MKEKVEALNNLEGYEIVRAMVRSLENPVIKIHNSSRTGFWRDGHFHGPISLNTILHMLEVEDVRDVMDVRNYGGDWSWPKELEAAIDELRRGNISKFNNYLISRGKPVIYDTPGVYLPHLFAKFPPYYLYAYRELAESQKYYMPFDIQSMKLDWRGKWENTQKVALVRHPKLSALGMTIRFRIQKIHLTTGYERLSIRVSYRLYGEMKAEGGLVAPIDEISQGQDSDLIFHIDQGPFDLLEQIQEIVHNKIRSFLDDRGFIKHHPGKNI